MTLVVPQRPRDRFGWHGHALLEKYYADDDLTREHPYARPRATPYEVVEAENLLLTAGATLVLNRLAGISATAIDATNGRMCVGDGVTAVSAGQTDLQGSNKFRQVFDAVPTVSGNQLQAVCTFGTGVANFHWQEAGLANSASGATLVDRFLQDFGTKSSTQWILTITITLT
jgi:hypothetical protein